MSNTYLIMGEQLTVVDPGSPLHVRLLCEYLERVLQRSPSEIKLVALTHLHLDHTAGLEALLQRCRPSVVASKIVRDLIRSRPFGRLPALPHLFGHTLPRLLDQLDLWLPAYEKQMRYVTTWVSDVEGLPGDPSWRVIASPGHTPDSLCLYNPFTAELLTGDTVVTVERGRPVARGRTSTDLLQETLHTLQGLRIHYLYPGHGWPILARNPLKTIRIEW
jgi:glyoxylase-like metal-dependent hydrolase (beta-lactamase superfamily II)